MDPDGKEFDADYMNFNKFVLDLDRRLSAIVIEAFDDCNGINSIFKVIADTYGYTINFNEIKLILLIFTTKLITILGTLLERDTLRNDFDPKYVKIVNILEEEMDETKKIYDEQKLKKDSDQQIAVHRNMPDVSGGLKWCQELRDRISKPMEYFNKLIDHPVCKSDQMERVNKKFQELLELLDAFVADIYKNWCSHVGSLSNNNLEKNLITRDAKTKSIKTNFDPQVRLLF